MGEVLDRMQRTMKIVVTRTNAQMRAKELVKVFDVELTTLSNVSFVQTKIKHDATLFYTVCLNVKNDLKTLGVCIKKMRKYIDEGKKLYG